MLDRKIDHRKRLLRQDLAAVVATTAPAVTTVTTTTDPRVALTTTTPVVVATTTTAVAATTTTTAAVVATTTTTTTVTVARETTTTATTVAAVTTTAATTTTAARETTVTTKVSGTTSVARSILTTTTSGSAARVAATTSAAVSSSGSAALATSSSGSSTSSSGGGISGAAVAGIIIVLLIIGGVAGTVWWKRRKMKAGEEELRKSYHRNTMNAGMADEWKGAGGNGGYGSLGGSGGVGANGNGFSEKFGENNGMTGMSSPSPYNPSNPYNSPGPTMPMMASYPPSNNVAPVTLVDSPVPVPNNNSRQSLVNPFQNPPQIAYQLPPQSSPIHQNIPRSLTPSITPPHPLSPADTGFSHSTDNSNVPLLPPNVGSMYQQSQHQQSSSFGSSSVPKTVSMISTSTINDKAIPSVLLVGAGSGTPKVGETGLNEFGGEETSDPFAGNQAGQGKIFTVVRTFEPTMGDELVIYPGDKVQILMSYDDGWVLGMNMSANPPQKGVFPRDCVEEGNFVPPSPSLVTDSEIDSAPASQRNTLIPNGYHDHQIASTIPEGDEEGQPGAVDHPLADPQRVSQIAPFLPPLSLEAPKSPAETITGATSTFAAQQSAPNSSPVSNSQSPVPVPRPPTTTTQPQRESLVVASETRDSVASGPTTPGKRTSSLIAGKDAELFMALGEALGDFGKVE